MLQFPQQEDVPVPPIPPEENQKSIRRLGRDTLLYGVASVLSRAVSFLMLPVYTRYLTPADYGILSILELSQEIAVLMFSAGATAGLMRFYFKANDATSRNRVLFTAWTTAAALNAGATVLLMLAAPLVWQHGLSGAGTVAMVRLAAANVTLSSLMLVPMQMLSIDQRPIASSLVLTGKLVLQLSLNILFVVGLRAGPIGVLWSTFVSGILIGLGMTVILIKRTGVAWDWEVFRNLRRFSLPIQISTIGTFFLAYGDRVFLEKFQGLAAVGVYGIAYQFGWLVSGMLGVPFFQAWNPQRFQLAHEERAHRDRLLNQGFLYGDMVLIGASVGLSLFIRPILLLMTTRAFQPAAAFVPILVCAYIFQNWTFVVDFGIEVSERTKYTSFATWSSVVVVAALYWLLIPKYAGMGAAIATLIAMMVRFGTTLYFAQRIWPVSYRWGPHVWMVVGGVAVTGSALLVPAEGFFALLIVAAFGLILYATWVWFGILHEAERSKLWNIIKSPSMYRSVLSA